jgi:hypothetical protein
MLLTLLFNAYYGYYCGQLSSVSDGPAVTKPVIDQISSGGAVLNDFEVRFLAIIVEELGLTSCNRKRLNATAFDFGISIAY